MVSVVDKKTRCRSRTVDAVQAPRTSAVITFKVKSVVTESANWKLAQLQVADTVSQINPTNWTAAQ